MQNCRDCQQVTIIEDRGRCHDCRLKYFALRAEVRRSIVVERSCDHYGDKFSHMNSKVDRKLCDRCRQSRNIGSEREVSANNLRQYRERVELMKWTTKVK